MKTKGTQKTQTRQQMETEPILSEQNLKEPSEQEKTKKLHNLLNYFSPGVKRVLKCIFFILILLCGLTCSCVGLWMLYTYLDFYGLIGSVRTFWMQYPSVSLFFMGLGLAYFGGYLLKITCRGTEDEDFYSSTIWTTITLFGTAVLFFPPIFVHVQVLRNLNSSMTDIMMNRYSAKNQQQITKAYNELQMRMKCCGNTDGISDWRHSVWWNTTGSWGRVPESCCVEFKDNKNFDTPEPLNPSLCYNAASNDSFPNRTQHVNTEGCYKYLYYWFHTHMFATMFTCLGFDIIVVLAFYLTRKRGECSYYKPQQDQQQETYASI